MTTPKIAFVGAGSTVFAKNLLGDILSYPELSGADIRLFDINQERLDVTEQVAHRVARTLGAAPQVSATTDRVRALDGADFVINMIQVGGYQPATVTDFEVPKQYGLRQTIADTLGIGGIMRGLRTIPVLADMSRDMERVCPDALHLNYVNPMAMNIWGLARLSPRIKTVGLCHSVQHTAGELATDLGIPVEEIDFLCAGINHMAFYLKFEHQGQSLYPRLMELAESGQVPEWNRVRYEMLSRLGYFVTESSEHFSEYTPYFIKRDRPDLLEKFNVPLDEYPRRCVSQIGGWEDLRLKLQNPDELLEVERSVEYGSLIIHSMVTGQPRVVYGNVMNSPVQVDGTAGHGKLISNLPDECSVEVPCLIDK
ncbi:alpha-glucosidase/alpha-galactosidase, partial [Deinococcus sp.]|uniref:alpha-glucosidase/alpha-galactosidase n=1 Tax=Deinococcus sp. TaxID=47478 RepID=UPI002869C9F4